MALSRREPFDGGQCDLESPSMVWSWPARLVLDATSLMPLVYQARCAAQSPG
jgi:hypothetical protein